MFTDCWLLGIWQLVVASNISTNSSSFWWSNGMTKPLFGFFWGDPQVQATNNRVARGTCSHQWSEAATPNHAAFHHSAIIEGTPSKISGACRDLIFPYVFYALVISGDLWCLPIPTENQPSKSCSHVGLWQRHGVRFRGWASLWESHEALQVSWPPWLPSRKELEKSEFLDSNFHCRVWVKFT